MATIYRANGTTETIEADDAKNGFKLEEMQAIVGGYIDTAMLPDGRIMVFNDDGKLDKLPFNDAATNLYGRFPEDFMVGDVLVCLDSEVK